MASVFDKIMPKLAATLVPKYGKSVTLTKVTEGAFDPATGSKTITESYQTIYALVEPVKASFGGEESGIHVGDVKLTMQDYGATAKPEIGDKITVDGVVYRVVMANAVYSGELKAMHVAYIRK